MNVVIKYLFYHYRLLLGLPTPSNLVARIFFKKRKAKAVVAHQ
jgi:hypothetical protein